MQKTYSRNDLFEHKELLQSNLGNYLKTYRDIDDLEKNFNCLNPIHGDSTPSMSYYPDTNKVFCHGWVSL